MYGFGTSYTARLECMLYGCGNGNFGHSVGGDLARALGEEGM